MEKRGKPGSVAILCLSVLHEGTNTSRLCSVRYAGGSACVVAVGEILG